MKVLDFSTADGALYYDVVYGGLLTSPRGFSKKETRVVSAVLDKLEAIGKPTGKGGGVAFELNQFATNRAVELEDAEFVLLCEALDAVVWTTEGARKAAKTFEWLGSVDTTR